MKSVSTQIGHIKRRLRRNEPLKGESLKFALSVIPGAQGRADDELFADMAQRLISSQALSEYQYHLLIDVFFVHLRLASPGPEPWMTMPINSETGDEVIAAMHEYFSRPRAHKPRKPTGRQK